MPILSWCFQIHFNEWKTNRTAKSDQRSIVLPLIAHFTQWKRKWTFPGFQVVFINFAFRIYAMKIKPPIIHLIYARYHTNGKRKNKSIKLSKMKHKCGIFPKIRIRSASIWCTDTKVLASMRAQNYNSLHSQEQWHKSHNTFST